MKTPFFLTQLFLFVVLISLSNNVFGSACLSVYQYNYCLISDPLSLIVTIIEVPAGYDIEIYDYHGNLLGKIHDYPPEGAKGQSAGKLQNAVNSILAEININKKQNSDYDIINIVKKEFKINSNEKSIGSTSSKKSNNSNFVFIRFFDEELKTNVTFQELDSSYILCSEIDNKDCDTEEYRWCYLDRPEFKIKKSFKLNKYSEIAIINKLSSHPCCPTIVSSDWLVFLTEKKRKSAIANLLGYRAYKEKKYELAKSYFTESIKYNPDFNMARFNLVCILSLQRVPFSEGIELLEKILSGNRKEYLKKIMTDSDLSFWRLDPRWKEWIKEQKLKLSKID